jgi:hypothetical protein
MTRLISSFLIAFIVFVAFVCLMLAFSVNRQNKIMPMTTDYERLEDYESKNCDEGKSYADRTDGRDDYDDGYGDWNRTWFGEMDRRENQKVSKINCFAH